MKTKDKISLIYKAIIIIVTAIGLILNFRLDHTGKLLLYFTILSNISCFVFYLIAFILKMVGKLEKNEFYYITKGLVTMSIAVTMVVYWMMRATDNEMNIYTNHMTACRFVHLYVPLLVMLDYVLFSEKGHLKNYYPLIWTGSLVLYGTFTIVYTILGGTYLNNEKFIYNFMDYEKLGMSKFIMINVLLVISYTTIGLATVKVDEIINKNNE